ncbi:helix-turn-helix domain-containing protein [Mobilitalea sibirica]|uniref:Helix-turn-helix domain-containing protein n=1 Tax=Mobilitalea sibirica TaxID=1462919 RepID=A0A8J7KZP9_9FIRM|nr:helix-turn-helix domain-containing protein [Mobilitalea sibirica]
MDWIKIIQNTIDEIENRINDKIDADILAESQFVSSFYFQKMFSVFCNCTVSEYIRNRRMTLAGYEIIDTHISILDIALKYGYDSNESFTKAFSRFHGITPSAARKSRANLKAFSKISPISNLTGGRIIMGSLGERGYIVKETGAVYYTEDMDKTLNWFVDVLGWYGQIEERDENNLGLYGCVNNIPMEIESLHIAPFTGIHMFKGEPMKKMIGFMLVQGIEQLYTYVKSRGWNDISEVVTEHWGGKTCEITTIDGSILKFFE